MFTSCNGSLPVCVGENRSLGRGKPHLMHLELVGWIAQLVEQRTENPCVPVQIWVQPPLSESRTYEKEHPNWQRASGYSYRRAWIGLSRAALIAGNRPATTPTRALNTTARTMASGVISGELPVGVM